MFLNYKYSILISAPLLMLSMGLHGQTDSDREYNLKVQRDNDKIVIMLAVDKLANLISDYKNVYRLLSVAKNDSELLLQFPIIFPLKRHNYNFFIPTSYFGNRLHPIYNVIKFHNGIDIPDVKGTTVYATASGVVEFAGNNKGDLGNYVRIKHKFGYETLYGHLSDVDVEVGQKVIQGEKIGKVGHTGSANGDHLHYILKKDGIALNPFQFCFLRLTLLRDSVAKSAILNGHKK